MRDNELPSQHSTTWIENLALEEIHMEDTGIVHFNEHLNPQALLEESSLKFMDDIRDKFEFYVLKFNMFRGNKEPGASIKIFKISNTINDFMLFRNSLKLIVARKANGLISLGLLSNSGGLFSPRLNMETPSTPGAHEIRAHIGPFNTFTWKFQGENLNIDSLVKHYLTEFIKHSAR